MQVHFSLAFLIGALRAVIELLGLCLLGQGVLYLIAGNRRRENPIYRLFDLLTSAPRRGIARLLPGHWGGARTGSISFLVLFVLWLGLAYLRNLV